LGKEIPSESQKVIQTSRRILLRKKKVDRWMMSEPTACMTKDRLKGREKEKGHECGRQRRGISEWK
jgi:hypothetical protein